MSKENLIQKIVNIEYLFFSNMENVELSKLEKDRFISSRFFYWNLFDENVLNLHLNNILNVFQGVNQKTETQTETYIDNLNLRQAEILSEHAKNIALEIAVPVVISVVDKFAKLLLFKKMENALEVSVELSPAKAQTAAAFKLDTDYLSKSSLSSALANFKSDTIKYCFLGGGIPIYRGDIFLGAIGISGGSVEQDIYIANKSIQEFLKG